MADSNDILAMLSDQLAKLDLELKKAVDFQAVQKKTVDDLTNSLTKLKTAYIGIGDSLGKATAGVKGYNTEASNMQKVVTLNSTGAKALGDAFNSQNKYLGGLVATHKQFSQSLKDGSSAGILQGNIIKDLNAGTVTLGANFTKSQQAGLKWQQTTNAIKQLGTEMEQAGKKAAILGGNMSRGITAGLAGVGFDAYKQAMGMQRQMIAQQQAMGPEFAKSRTQINTEVESIGHALGINRVQMAGLYAEYAKDGYGMQQVMGNVSKTSNSQIGALAETTAKLSMMTGVSLGQAKESVKELMGVMGTVNGIKGFSAQIDATNTTLAQLSNIGNVSNISMSQLLSQLPKLAEGAKLFNMTLGQTGTVLAAMTQAGIPAEQTATSLNFAMSRVLNASSPTGGGLSAAAKILHEFGIEGVGAKPGLQVLGQIGTTLAKLRAEGNMAAADKLLFGAFGARQGTKLGGALETITQQIQTYVDTLNKGGEAAQTAYGKILKANGEDPNKGASALALMTPEQKKRVQDPYYQRQQTYQKSAPFKMEQAKQDIQGMLGQLGTQFLPVIQRVLETVDKLVQKFTNLSGPVKTLITSFLLAVAALGPVLMIFGNLAQVGGHMMKLASGMNPLSRGIKMISENELQLRGQSKEFIQQLAQEGKLIGTVGDKLVITTAKGKEQLAILAELRKGHIEEAAATEKAAESQEHLAVATEQATAAAKKEAAVPSKPAIQPLLPELTNKEAVTQARASLGLGTTPKEVGQIQPGRVQAAVRDLQDRRRIENEGRVKHNHAITDPAAGAPKVSRSLYGRLQEAEEKRMRGESGSTNILGGLSKVGGLAGKAAIGTGKGYLAATHAVIHPTEIVAAAKWAPSALKKLKDEASKALDNVPVIGSLKRGAGKASSAAKGVIGKGAGKLGTVAGFIPGGSQAMELGSMAASMGPWGIAAAAVAAAIFLIYKNWDKLKDSVTTGVNAIKAAFSGIVTAVKAPFEQLLGTIFGGTKQAGQGAKSMGDVWKQVGTVLNNVFKAVAAVMNYLKPIFAGIASIVASALGQIISVVQGVVELFQGHWDRAFDYFKQAAAFAVKGIIDLFTLIPSFFINMLSKIIDKKIFGHKLPFADEMKSGLSSLAKDMEGWGTDVAKHISSGIDKAPPIKIGSLNPFNKKQTPWHNKDVNDNAPVPTDSAPDQTQDIQNTQPGDDTGVALKEKLKQSINKEMERMIKAAQDVYEQASKKKVEAIDAEIKALEEKKKKEDEVLKAEEEAAKRKELLDRKSMEMDSYKRERAELIYEGKIDQARQLDVTATKQQDTTNNEIIALDNKSKKEQIQDAYDTNKIILAAKKQALTDELQAQKDKLNDELAAIKENTPKTVGEYQDRMNQVKAVLEAAGVDAKAFEADYGKDAGTAFGDAEKAAVEAAKTDAFFKDQGTAGMNAFTGAAGAALDADIAAAGSAPAATDTAHTNDTTVSQSQGSSSDTRAEPSVSSPRAHVQHSGGMANVGYGQEYPAVLQGGEYVVRKEAVNSLGVDTLHSLNKFHTGGFIGKQEVSAGRRGVAAIPKIFGPKLETLAEAKVDKGQTLTSKLQAIYDASTGGSDGSSIISYAKKFLGIPYLFGGDDPAVGLDCSSFLQNVFKHFGKMLPRVSWDQLKMGSPVNSLADALPGDILGFNGGGHVGLYEGNGRMIDAPHTGSVIREESVWEGLETIRRIMGGGRRRSAVGPVGDETSSGIEQTIISVAKSLGAPYKVILSAMETGIVESGMRNLTYGDSDSLGVFQQRPSQGWGTADAGPNGVMNVAHAAREYLMRALGSPFLSSGSAGQLAQSVQLSGYPDRYDQEEANAINIMKSFGYDSGGILKPGLTMAMNKTGKPEYILTNDQWSKLTASMSTIASGASGGAVGSSSMVTHNVQVGTFIGEKAWFDKMMAEYKRTTERADNRASGRINRVIGNSKDAGVLYSKGD